MEMDPEAALELKKRSSLLREHGIGKAVEKISSCQEHCHSCHRPLYSTAVNS